MDISRYVDLFLAESREHLGAAHDIRERLGQEPDDAVWHDLLRHAHSLKGMAATMGYRSMVVLAHAVEGLVGRLHAAPATIDRNLPRLDESLACLGRLIDRIEVGGNPEDPAAEALARSLGSAGPHPAEPLPDPSAPPAFGTAPDGDDLEPGNWRVELILDGQRTASAAWTVATLGQLSNLGRVVRADPPLLALDTGRFEGRLRFILRSDLPRPLLQQRLDGLPGVRSVRIADEPARRRVDAPPSVGPRWVRVRAELLDRLAEQLLQARLEQGRLGGELPLQATAARQLLRRSGCDLDAAYATLVELRLVPFESAIWRLQQSLRELCLTLNKECRLEVEGGQVRLDRNVLDGLVEPLMHVVRNAVDHGIESAAERIAVGKQACGTIRLTLEQRGDRLHLSARDDGRGMDPEALRRRAVELGLADAGVVNSLGTEDALLLATIPGCSTARRVTEISGRGIGLDVVRDALERLGGILEIQSVPGVGTELRMSVPSRVVMIRTLLVRCSGELYAVPLDAVLRTQRRAPAGGESDCEEGWLLNLRGGEREVRLRVDEVLGRQDLVVKPFRAPLAHLREYSGAATIEDGSIVLVLDPLHLTAKLGADVELTPA